MSWPEGIAVLVLAATVGYGGIGILLLRIERIGSRRRVPERLPEVYRGSSRGPVIEARYRHPDPGLPAATDRPALPLGRR